MRPVRFAGAVLAIALAAAPSSARATPLDFVPVGDPLEDEWRILDVLGPSAGLPHLGMRPLQVTELPAFELPGSPAATIAQMRLRRGLARDRAIPDSVDGATPRLLQLTYPSEERFETSVALEGSGEAAGNRDPDFTSPSGGHVRVGLQVERWVAHSQIIVGHVDRGLDFSEALVPGSDAIVHSEEAYLAYTGQNARWGVQMGRSRWHWGPGEEAGILLSRTSAPLTGMALHLRVAPLRADGMVFSATIDDAGGEQLAAHRLEWQPRDGLRVGLSEAVRYKSTRWEPLYWIGVLPYSMVQEMLVRDVPDSNGVLRNNVEASIDVAWRFQAGQRIYGELLIDDLRTNAPTAVSKYGFLAGWEGVRSVGPRRLSWNVELARISRFVYTSFFGRAFVAQDRPLGYPTGPDSRHVRVRVAWDPSDLWQWFAVAARTDAGESGIDRPLLPTGPREPTGEFLGTVEHTTQAMLGVRYWPSSGIDLSVSGGFRRVDNAGHVEGTGRKDPFGELRIRLLR